MEAYTQCLEVDEEGLRLDGGVENIRVASFAHPHIFNNGKDKLSGIALGGC